MLPPFRQIKFEGKFAMMRSMPFWIKATLLLILLQVGSSFLVDQMGGFLARPLMGPIDQSNGGLVTGLTRQDDQFLFLVRLEVPGLLVGIAASFAAMRNFLIFGGLSFLLLAPFKMGLLELYWKAFRGQEFRASEILHWYKSPARIGKALIVQFVVSAGSRILMLFVLAPGYILYYLAYSGSFVSAGNSGLFAVLSLLAVTALFVGLLAGFFCYAVLAPLAYCLAAQPDYSLSQVFKKGFGSIKGYTKRFFYFRLSLLPWHIVSNMTLGIAELYIFPYVTFASYQFLQAAAVDRKGKEPRENDNPELN